MGRQRRPAAMVMIFCAGLAACGGGSSPTPVAFSNPPEWASHDGVLEGVLTVEPAELRVAGRTVAFRGVYNGLYMPPVLRVQPGDVVRLTLANFGMLSTNVHYHGLRVSPLGAGDNVFIDITPRTLFQYDMPIPADHPQGLFWYHPHFHPDVNTQIAGGLSGGLIVGDILAPFPTLADIPERIMLLKDLKLADGAPVVFPDPAGPTLRTINGLYKPRLTMQPGQLEFWRLGNVGANIYYEITLDGQPFYVMAQDGTLQNQLVETTRLILPPGKRLELLIFGPPRGTYRLRAEPFNTGPEGDAYPGQTLASVASTGAAVAPIALPASFPVVRDLRDHPIDMARTVTFADTDDPNVFTINGRPYDHHCIDTLVPLGTVEQWTILNTSQEAHVFHIHQIDFQVTAINGVAQPFIGYQDTIDLPPAVDDDTPSSVTAILPFDDPVILGEFVYHCHIVQHADLGMMANILVYDPALPLPPHHLCDPFS